MAEGACILAPLGLTLAPEEAAFFRAVNPWGFILFARNIDRPDQVRTLTASLREAVGRNAPIFTDQEGGRVQRMRAPHWREWRPPLDEALACGAKAPQALALRYQIIARELRDLGLDGNCVPCLDIATETTHPFLKNRCLGMDAKTVAENGQAVIDGTRAGGCLAVMKHMPGHGRSVSDSHEEVPRVTVPRETLLSEDFTPFGAVKHALGMSCHCMYEAFDERPGTFSPVITEVIRSEIGFQGLYMTDDISMGALSGSLAERSQAAIAAGCDLVLHCNGKMSEMQAVAEYAGQLQGAAQDRAEAAIMARDALAAAPGDIDMAALVAAYEQL